jgi:hypothetical protein
MVLWPPEGMSGEDCPTQAEVLRGMAGLPEGEPVERYPGDLLQALENARYDVGMLKRGGGE